MTKPKKKNPHRYHEAGVSHDIKRNYKKYEVKSFTIKDPLKCENGHTIDKYGYLDRIYNSRTNSDEYIWKDWHALDQDHKERVLDFLSNWVHLDPSDVHYSHKGYTTSDLNLVSSNSAREGCPTDPFLHQKGVRNFMAWTDGEKWDYIKNIMFFANNDNGVLNSFDIALADFLADSMPRP